jgi:hypothetical protein
MNSTKNPAPRLNPLRQIIQRTTGAPARDLSLIENIMRDDIFHSTLDWQTREQLVNAARHAFTRLNDNLDLYEFGRARAMAVFRQLRAASAQNH